ncbi:YeeE/YedE family protein [Bradyrhizobium roseum]|uniref:YeeE/YedE family protein n=1 Tax=Bradyrhizobium roseum TaxID=3056648 RepID=UPI0026123DF0|nr:YeeE/YedE family protein [Bradyrhizobium roseus]WKA27419.1 YeeE/YedE family protein [Bradyrhizobium roseus]
MDNFTPVSAAIGGALIGLSAVLLMLSTGRIAGISGIFAGLLNVRGEDKSWRIAFLAGLILAPVLAGLIGYGMAQPALPSNWTFIAVAGLLVGFGTRLGGGCTSGHGICGIAGLSPRSVAATVIFMVMAIVTVAVTRHVLGG